MLIVLRHYCGCEIEMQHSNKSTVPLLQFLSKRNIGLYLMFLYFNLCPSVIVDSLSCSTISFFVLFEVQVWSICILFQLNLLQIIHIHVLGYLEINTLISTILTHQSSTLFSIVYYISSLLMTFDVVFMTICFTNFNSFNVLF